MIGLEGRCPTARPTKQKALYGNRTRVAGLGSRCLATRLTEQTQEDFLLQTQTTKETIGEGSFLHQSRRLSAMAAKYMINVTTIIDGYAWRWIRTTDNAVNGRGLCLLSYPGMISGTGIEPVTFPRYT